MINLNRNQFSLDLLKHDIILSYSFVIDLIFINRIFI